jgi:cytochrome oxidase Cu insertion factor (SCO1/SenC/PrrC family)
VSEIAERPQRNRARLSLVILWLIFLIPVVAAWWLFYGGEGWRAVGTVNQGELVQPVRPLELTGLTDLDGNPVPADVLKDKWFLVYLGDSQCAEPCQYQLYTMRQVRIAQNQNAYRVATAYLVTDGGRPLDHGAWAEAYPDLRILRVTDRAAVLDQFRIGTESDAQTEGRLFMVDPLGNLMMRYGQGDEHEALMKDLKRILKVSPLAK